MAKKQAKKVTNEVVQNDADQELIVQVDKLYSDEELQALIEKGQQDYEAIHGEGSSWIPRFLISDELASALMSRNKRNRFKNPKRVNAYADLMLSNEIGSDGNPIKGSSKWDYGLPCTIYMSDEGNLHNSQKCLSAKFLAKEKLRKNANEVLAKKKDVTDIVAETGLSAESLEQLSGVLINGFSEKSADMIDTAEQRKNPDLGFRRGLFDEFDFSLFKSPVKEGSSTDFVAKSDQQFAERIPALMQKMNVRLNTLAGFVWKRLHDGGKLPRVKPSYGEFNANLYVASIEAYPQMAASVYNMEVVKKQSKGAIGGKAGIACPYDYLVLAHFLASMHDAKKNKKTGEWEQSDEGLQWANSFISAICTTDGPEKIYAEWRIKLKETAEQRTDAQLNGIMSSIGHLWRNHRYDEELRPLSLLMSGTLVDPVYGDVNDTFDVRPVVEPKPIIKQGTIKPAGVAATPVKAGPAFAKPNISKK